MIVVDDRHLFALLADQADPGLQADLSSSGVFTTSAWYYRLARAAHDTRFLGALSRQIEALDPDGRRLVLELLDELPSTVGILSPRVLVPVMAKLTGVQLNLLAAEAVGTAVVLEAALRVVTASPPLESACEHFGIELVVTPAAG